MTTKTALLALSPTLAFAYECNWDKHQETTALSCAESTVLDEETGTCIPVVTGQHEIKAIHRNLGVSPFKWHQKDVGPAGHYLVKGFTRPAYEGA